MKTKILTKISSFIILFVMCTLMLVGCSVPWDGPKTEDDVTGNGGIAVQKGEYLYFVNGYTSKSNMKAGDNKGDFNYSSIYKAKLNENNELEYDEDGKLLNCSKIVSKVAGFDNTSLYIFGDYMYFASPYADTVTVLENNQYIQKHNFKLTDFYRVRLDGADLKLVYRTNTDSDSNLQFGFYQTADSSDVNLAVFDGTKLVVVNCSTSGATTVCENVSSVAMPKVSDFKYNNNQVTKQESAIYYTRTGTEEENLSKGNVLAYTVIGENQEKIIAKGQNTYKVKTVTKDALVVSIQTDLLPNTCDYFVTFDQTGAPQFDLNEVLNQNLNSNEKTSLYLCAFEDGNPVGVISTNSKNKLVFTDYRNNNTSTVLNDDLTLTPLAVVGNYVYAYDSNNSLYRINYKQAAASQDKASLLQTIYDSTKVIDEQDESVTAEDIYFSAKTNFSVVGNNVYFYLPSKGEEKTGYYLNRVNLLDSENTTYLVAEIQPEHIVVEEEIEE